MLEQFESVWDGHLRSITAVQHQIEFDKTHSKAVPCDLYSAGRNVRECEKQAINRMLAINIAEHGKPEWASPIVSVSC